MPNQRFWNLAGAVISSLFLLLFLLVWPSPAVAYADPGTGAYLFQAAYAAVIGAAFYFRKFISRLCRKREK